MRKTTLKLTPVRINGERFFQVISPKPGGGRIRRTFKDQGDAEHYFRLAEKQIASYGAAAMQISDTLRIAAIEADKLLQPFGKTIVEAAQFYLAHLKAISASATVSHAISKLPHRRLLGPLQTRSQIPTRQVRKRVWRSNDGGD